MVFVKLLSVLVILQPCKSELSGSFAAFEKLKTKFGFKRLDLLAYGRLG